MMKIEMDVGATEHGQAVKVIARRVNERAPWVFDIEKQPANQRDDMVIIRGLTLDAMEGIGKAVQAARVLPK